MSYLPANVGYAVSNLSGYSRNTYKLIPNSSSTLNPGQILQVPLPEGSIADLRSFKVYFKAVATGYTDGTDTVYARLPGDAQSLFNRVTIQANGIQLNGSNGDWGAYCKMSKVARTSPDRNESFDKSVQHGAVIEGVAADESAVMCCAEFPGTFLSTSSTRFIHTGALGSLIVGMTVADNSVLFPVGASGSGTLTAAEEAIANNIKFRIEDVYATVTCVSLGSLYDELLMSRLSEDPLRVDYIETYNFAGDLASGQTQHTTRFSVATRSLNRVLASLRDATYATVGKGGHELADSTGDAWVEHRHKFRLGDDHTNQQATYQFNVNGTPVPSYRAKCIIEGLAGLMEGIEDEDGMGQAGRGNLCFSQQDYNGAYGVLCCRFNHPCGMKPETKVASGLNTQGVNAQAFWNQEGLKAGNPALQAVVMAETQPQLEINLGKMVSVNF